MKYVGTVVLHCVLNSLSYECGGRLDCADLIFVKLLDRGVRNRKFVRSRRVEVESE